MENKQTENISSKEQKKVKIKSFHLNDVIFEDTEGEYRYNDSNEQYEYYPDWLGYVQSEAEFWETR